MTLTEYYAGGGTLIEDYDTGTYLSITDSATFKDIFDKIFNDRTILGTAAQFKQNWSRIFFKSVLTYKERITGQTGEAAIAAYEQLQKASAQIYPQNGLTPISAGYQSSEQKTYTGSGHDLRKRIADDQMKRRNFVSLFVDEFHDIFSCVY